MLKRVFSLIMAIALVLSMSSGFAKACSPNALMTGSFEFDGETYTYRYREVDGQVVYAEIGEDVIEKKENVIYVNGIEVASYTETMVSPSSLTDAPSAEEPMAARTGWIWTENGNPADYETTAYDTKVINISLKQTLGTIAVATLATIIVGILPISKIASVVAGSVIGGLGSGFAAYFSSTTLYCKETIYKNKYIGISYDKKVHQKYYYDSELTDAVPDSEKTLYASWG